MSVEGEIPAVAALWIVRVLPSRRVDWVVEHLETHGLELLTVKELKTLGEALSSKSSLCHGMYLPVSAKKPRRVEIIHRAFFRDTACTIVNQTLMEELSREIHATPSSQHASSSIISTSNSSRKRHSPHIPSLPADAYCPYPPNAAVASGTPFYPMVPPPNSGAHFSILPGMLPISVMPTTNLPQLEQQQPSPKKPKPQNTLPRKSFPPVKVKQEKQNTIDASEHPRNPQEHQLLRDLMQMGFPDRREILTGIRQSGGTTSDHVMIWIVSQREEVEEAHKMDQARLCSEELRKEQSEQRAQTVQERLDSANHLDDLRQIFDLSWILKRADSSKMDVIVKSHKEHFVKFLQLEQKARQWYGTKLPSYYFVDQSQNLVEEATVGNWLQSECDRLTSALYKLEHQQGGVPKLFLEAQEAHSEEGVDFDVDTDIVVVKQIPKPENSNGECKNSSAEVIEID